METHGICFLPVSWATATRTSLNICSALRLARFNVSLYRTDQPAWKNNYFVGVPAPAGALILVLYARLSARCPPRA